MKNLKLFLFIFLFATIQIAIAQTPQAVSYQAVISDGFGAPILNTVVGLRFTIIMDNSEVYQEEHFPNTGPTGKVELGLGKGVALFGDFTQINWLATQPKLQVELDYGNGYIDMGSSDLRSVFYALYADKAAIADSIVGIDLSNFEDNQTLSYNEATNTLTISEGNSIIITSSGGSIGPQGPTGATGPQGEVGLQGPAGIDGQDGINGVDGQDGATGPQGPQGDPATDDQTLVWDEDNFILSIEGGNSVILPISGGSVGPQGPAGATGPQGEVGPQGPAGTDGQDGINGVDGQDGATGPQGIQGSTGAVGPQGSAGATGPQGEVGPQGPAGNDGQDGINGVDGQDGAIGPQGIQGATGAVGPQGPQGDPATDDQTLVWDEDNFILSIEGGNSVILPISGGSVGPQGPAGAPGPQGIQGATGATGPQGPQGDPATDDQTLVWDEDNFILSIEGGNSVILPISGGSVGPQGPAGATGPQGIQGATGAVGPQGPAGNDGQDGTNGVDGQDGATGPQGIQGVTGAIGPQGPAGTDGQDGINGVDGQDGAPGPQGIQGATGATGPQGPQGDPATDDQTLVWDEDNFILSIEGGNSVILPISGGSVGPQGPAGATGPQGEVGPQGPAGTDGQDGINGINGIDGQDGATGPQGIQGVTGAVGPQGPAGNDGQDGINGQDGAPGPQGIQGVTGAVGPQGPAGNDGQDGINGQDGATGPQGETGSQGPQGLLPDGSSNGNTTYWNGTSWVVNSSNIYNSGNLVGIGTNDPTTKLDINGQIRVRGGEPSIGKVLTSDADGLATWENIPVVEMGTLNQAYNAGGPGTGREIIADSGAVLINGTDGILVTGILGQGRALEVSNTNPSMLFYPKKAAFRVGQGLSTTWTDANIGDYSVAMGSNTIAKGTWSFAVGAGSQAIGQYSSAFGNAKANADGATAMGFLTQANGTTSTALGNRNKANGFASIAMGFENIANASSSLVAGRYNDTIVSSGVSVVNSTPLFIIGNGTATNARSNAMVVQFDAKTGIATSAPKAQLHVSGDDGFLVTGTINQGQDLDISGAGTRMFFYPKLGAFRAGNIENDNWDASNLGYFSFAVGYGTKAQGDAAIAMGYETNAVGLYSTAMGWRTQATVAYSTSMGLETRANASASTAMGAYTIANGTNSTAMGRSTLSNGWSSLVIGAYNDTIVSPQTAFSNSTPLFVIGNGTSSILRKNAMVVLGDAKTGIATSTPEAQLHVAGTDGFLVTGTYGSGEAVAIAGAGSRMFFNPRKSAFRVGYVDGNNWNVDSIGDYSTAMGWNAKALGARSFSAGDNTLAQSYAAVAMGISTEARFTAATAFGRSTKAMGNSSTAMGNNTISNASSSLAVGYYNDPIVTQQTSTVPTATSPLFIVGNGTSDAVRTNALVIRKDARMGVSTSNPLAQLHVAGTDGLLVTGTYGSGATIVNGAATRMYFNPRTGAFRAGRTTNDSWDASNVGNYSFAAGLNSKAIGGVSTAIGADVEAISAYEIALGRFNTLYTPINANDWDAADRLLVVGNGTSSGARNDAFTILKSGRVGINTSSPEAGLHIKQRDGVTGASIVLEQATDKKWRLYSATAIAGSQQFYFEYNGTNKAAIAASNGDYTSFSDIRLKKDVQPLNQVLSKVMQLNPVTFRYNDNSDEDPVTTGFIAQEVQALFPDLVVGDTATGYLSLSKSNFGVLAIKAIQELKTELDAKSTEVDELKQMFLTQQAQMQQMMERIEALENE